MVATIVGFEFSQRLRRISTYVYFLVFLLLGCLFAVTTGGAIPGASVDFGTGGKGLVNSPYTLNLIITFCSFFGVVITAAIAGQATYQDVDTGIAPFFYTSPITKFDYLMGRFLGALLVQVVIFASVGFGVWIGAHLPWIDPTRLGPDRFSAYIGPYLIMVLPNLLLCSAIFFAIAANTRKMLPVYVSSVLLLIGYFVAGQLSTNETTLVAAALADPFGGSAIDRLTRYWTPFERNTRLIPFNGILLANRALWLAVAALVFAFTYIRFSFSYAASGKNRGQQVPLELDTAVTALSRLPVVHPVFSSSASLRQFLSLTRLQFSETVKNIFFVVLIFAGWLFAVFSASGITDPLQSPVYPVTYRMLEQGGGGFFVFALAIVTFVAGELVWRERDAHVDQITDALPVRGWVLSCSKLSALMLVQVLLVLVILVAGLSLQIAKGYYRFEFDVYFEYLAIRLVGLWILCTLAFFIHTIVNQKYLGHFVMVLYYIAMIALPPLGFQHHLYLVGQIPRFVYSDMNGFGPYAKTVLWFAFYWAVAAVLLAVVTNLLWVRGNESGWRNRFHLAAANLSTATRVSLFAGAALFIAVGSYIFYNTNILNTYASSYQVDNQRAQYEKKYRRYFALPQPRITDINLQIDLDPRPRSVNVAGVAWLENKTDSPMDRLAITIWPSDLQPLPRPPIEVKQLAFTGGATRELDDAALGFSVYRLTSPLPPHGRVAMNFSLNYPNPGFVNGSPNTDIVHNGSFLNNSYMPVIGYRDDIELDDDTARHRHGLQKVKRMPKLEDPAAHQDNAITGKAADWVNFEATVSTSPDQIALMPGYLDKEWTESGRRYFHYKMDAPILAIASLNSARYAVRRDRWRDVNLEIDYHPGHEFDLDRMMRSMKATLDYCTVAFSPFQFRQLRIVEFPRYGTFAESFPNTIPFSEGIGFITYVNPKKPDAIDLPFFVTAHEVGHQWWGHQVVSANTEGATAIVETLAQYTSFMVMKHTYGAENMKKFLRFELDAYLRGRAQERNEEKPLYRVEANQGYIHYAKGGLVMYALQDYIGEAAVSQALSDFVKAHAFKGAPYPTSLDLIASLKKVTPPEFQYLFDDFFENITIYDDRALSATYRQQPGGKYQVHLSVEALKYRADGRGQEHSIPVHDSVDIGVLDKEGHFLYLQRHQIDRQTMEFDITVDKLPASAGIDPLIKLIDRNPDDNVVAVEAR